MLLEMFILYCTHTVLVLHMPRKDYRNVSVPTGIHSALVEVVGDEKSLYTSVSDLVKEALREKIIAIRSQSIVPGRRQSGGNGKS